MHGLLTGARMRRISVVGVFMLVMLALATHVTVARADTGSFTTSITSPTDPSFYYDSTAGAYGSITVTGTTNGTDPSTAGVDIDCYVDDGNSIDSGYYNSGGYEAPDAPVALASVQLDANGDFSATVPYSTLEQDSYDQDGACRLRAVPADTTPGTGLSSYVGPRVLVSYLSLEYNTYVEGGGTILDDYGLTAPALGAYDFYGDAYFSESGCALSMALPLAPYFSESNDDSIGCADSFDSYGGQLEVGGQQVQIEADSNAAPAVAASQNPADGDLTIHESDPLEACVSDDCYSDAQPLPIVLNRTIQQADQGKLVVLTDDFTNTSDTDVTDVTDDVGTNIDLGDYNGNQLEYDFPGTDGYASYGYTPNPAGPESTASGPATIYAENPNSSSEGLAALTYFTTPNNGGPYFSFYVSEGDNDDNDLTLPYEFTIPANGSVSLSFAYSTEYGDQSDFAGDLSTALDLQSAPTVSITSPAGGSTTASSTVTVTGIAMAATGVQSVTVNGVAATVSGGSFSATVPLTQGSNTLQATITTDTGVVASTSEMVTYDPSGSLSGPTSTITPKSQAAWAGAVWNPIADTGNAKRAGHGREALGGRVTSGSGSVKYYFDYGTTKRFGHKTQGMLLSASKLSRAVKLSVNGLVAGRTYHYRLVAVGKYGQSTGAGRTFKVAKGDN
jgi:Glucodextranase, domain B